MTCCVYFQIPTSNWYCWSNKRGTWSPSLTFLAKLDISYLIKSRCWSIYIHTTFTFSFKIMSTIQSRYIYLYSYFIHICNCIIIWKFLYSPMMANHSMTCQHNLTISCFLTALLRGVPCSTVNWYKDTWLLHKSSTWKEIIKFLVQISAYLGINFNW